MAKEALLPIPHKLFLKREVEGTLPNSFCEDSVILIPESEKHIFKKEINKNYGDKKPASKI